MARVNWSDEDLAQRLCERDPKALEALISRYSREVFSFIRIVLAGVGVIQDAEECVNDLFVAVWQEIDRFDSTRGTLRTWLTMRAKYIALDRRRQLCRCQAYNVQSSEEMKHWYLAENYGDWTSFVGNYNPARRATLLSHPEASMENLLEQSERREELSQALATLPELDRFLIYQRYFRFASTEELATKTGLTPHAIDTRLWRARKSLRDTLKKYSYESEQDPVLVTSNRTNGLK